MSDAPVIPSPYGVISNFDDPPSEKKILIIVNCVSICLMAVCVVVQYYTKIFISMDRLRFEDR